MKKIAILCISFLILTSAISAAADSVWTPMDDYFRDTWTRENDNTCTPETRPFYLAAGERGYVTAVKTPLDQTKIKTYPNGTEFKISFVCGKGNDLWGTIEAVRMPGEITFKEDWRGESGYIAFGDLVRSYDSDAFTEDHISELVSAGEDDFDFCAGNEFVLWTAPNSGVQLEYVDKNYLDYLCMEYDSGYRPYHFGAFYRDPDGKRWVEVELRRITEHGWYCLDAMTEGGVKPVY